MIIRAFSTVSPHTRHGVPTRGERSQVSGTLPWWVRDCNSKVTGKAPVGHAGLRSPIATWPPQAQLTFVGMSGLFLNLIRTSDGADWALAATTSALPSRLKLEGQSATAFSECDQYSYS